jgi:L,D-transpeptidase YcbB
MKTLTYNSSHMKLFILAIYILAASILPQTVQGQNNDSRFSIRNFFGLSGRSADTIFVNDYVELNDIDKWPEEISEFYSNRNFIPVWIDEKGQLNRLGTELTEQLETSWEDGFPDMDEKLQYIDNSLKGIKKLSSRNNTVPEKLSELDVFLTRAYFDYASALSTGLIDPAKLDVTWTIIPEKNDLVSHLEQAANKGDITGSLEQLKPEHKQYELLKQAYHELMEAEADGGWPLPGSQETESENDSEAFVIRLKEYLYATGDLSNEDSAYMKSTEFDSKLTEAVKSFQIRHGLLQDGIPGKNTLEAMNVPLTDRLNQIRLNLERMRWLPDDFGSNHIIINIPDFSFEFYRQGELIQEMNVVVGQNENYTPVLEDTLNTIIFNPTWNVPNSIATEEIFPKMMEDSAFMKKNDYSVLRDSYVSKDTIDIHSFDWSEVSRDSFPFFIIQHPGPLNSLGRIQFMLQNQYSIYLHDTPADHLFDREQRDFSHGCVRLEQPEELAMTLLQDQLPNDSIMKFMSEDEKKVIRLEERIPVHLIYQTAWANDDNMLHFREDIYGFDEITMEHLQKLHPEITAFKRSKKQSAAE